MNEIWRDIEGFEGRYQISSLGRVKSFLGKKERILNPTLVGSGYRSVCLTNTNGEINRFYIHRLVAITFIPNPENLPQVNHKDEDKNNNTICNLEWITAQDNINYGTRALRYSQARGEDVLQYSLDMELIAEYHSAREAGRQTGFPQTSISMACRRKNHKYKDFIWMYREVQDEI